MSDLEQVEKCDVLNSEMKDANENIHHTKVQEFFNSSPERPEAVNDAEIEGGEISNAVSQDGKGFVNMDGELDFEDETLSPEKTDKSEEQSSVINEATSKASKTPVKQGKDKEDGQCTPEKGTSKAKGDCIEDGEDDGECSDDDDLEEGELKDRDETLPKEKARQVCRFFNRGQCFYGLQCRFLHLNNSVTKGNYNMFAPTPRTYEPIGNVMGPPGMLHRSPRTGPDLFPVPPLLPLPPVELAEETAWEKGLREAKELVKKANKRKEDPDFEDKRLNLTVNLNERNTINDKENDGVKTFKKKKREREENDVFKYDQNFFDTPYDRGAHFGNRYENFEIRYTDRGGTDRGGRSRMRGGKTHEERTDKVGRFNDRDVGNWRNDRMQEVQKARGEDYFDPWRRSKSPKHNRRSRERDRSRSFGSYSSVSSYSSRSSCSYSRSSSRSSRGSSRRTSSSRSRSLSRGRSIYSRSSRSSRSPLSMDSVSSASSSVSRSSSVESLGHPNKHVSIFRKQDEKPVEKADIRDGLPGPPTTSAIYFQMPRSNKFEKAKEPLPIQMGITAGIKDPLEETFQKSQPTRTLDAPFFQSLQHILPPPPPEKERERPKEPMKSLHPPKQQIKLTLLNKNPQSKLATLPKKDLEVNKVIKQTDEISKLPNIHPGVKRPLSPPAPIVVTKPPPVTPKKSASSRRDELLKQLKAVEDAIARKRAKFC